MYTNNFYISNILKNFQSSSISLMNMHIKTITLKREILLSKIFIYIYIYIYIYIILYVCI
ncbi:hypothetical protein PFUGPA_04594 [Plasmodium falciparum Palo Alto/Uganda]|uniref:Uncharacterized protein n=1 Tax=Plasmodium falciparum (isolate Palo Alto / Uganda) TaxID=57270 RepID=W4IUA9_PLAFP|nr:hypothetical protein PFUGPA_04594 [Plasmodium falciparum Palo Alto/Uganda]